MFIKVESSLSPLREFSNEVEGGGEGGVVIEQTELVPSIKSCANPPLFTFLSRAPAGKKSIEDFIPSAEMMN